MLRIRCTIEHAEEISQSRARIMIATGVTLVLAAVLATSNAKWDDGLGRAIIMIGTYGILGVAWLPWVKRTPDGFRVRRYVTLFTDLLVTTLGLHFAGEHAPFFYPIYLWIIMGYGLRYGERPMMVGVILGLTGFGTLLRITPFWQTNEKIGVGLAFGIVVLPLFYLTVLRRVRRLNIRLEEELEKSQAAEKAKGEFLANMSHEIRTPMNGVLGMTEIIADGELSAEQRENVEVVARSAESLLNIINDILDYSKIASGRMILEKIPFDLEQTLLDVHLLLKATADEKDIALNFTYPEKAPRVFRGDPTRVRQIAFNLTGNAIKFTSRGSVDLECRVEGCDDRAAITLEVRDTGEGIAADRVEAIFEQFEQADPTTGRRHGGTGLGLAISRQLLGLMDGELEVTSELGQGSIFRARFALPCAKESVVTRSRRLTNVPQFGLHALVAEDNSFNQRVVAKMLAKVGITSEIVANGMLALARLNRRHDLVFMDVRMPGLSGHEAAAAIRSRDDELADVPIIALTADSSPEDAQLCLDAGMDVHLRKPLRLKELIDAVNGVKFVTRV